MIEIKVSGNTIEEAVRAMARALEGIGAASAVKNEAKGTVEVAHVKEEVPILTLAEVKKLAKVKLDEGKSGEVKELLKKMDVKKVGDLQEEQFAEFVKGLEAL